MAILQTANASYAIRLKPDPTYYPADASFVTHVGSAFRRVGHEALAFGDETLQCLRCVRLAGVHGADEIHRHVRVDEDHGFEAPAYPRSVSSRSTWSRLLISNESG